MQCFATVVTSGYNISVVLYMLMLLCTNWTWCIQIPVNTGFIFPDDDKCMFVEALELCFDFVSKLLSLYSTVI